ncbi:MAG: lipase [Tildeniella nuda ZEHNDER 1965/U140]|jgi:predicted lipase|nr:lipase [Tildeniella nuda ZEHNDER 1965/U140]
MVKFTRRQLLLTGLATGITVTGTHRYFQLQSNQKRQAELEALARAKVSQRDAYDVLKSWFGAGDEKIEDALKLKEAVTLATPTIPYNRAMSKLLIQCSRICTYQYAMSKLNPTYDGAIKALPAYSKQLDGYTQIASIKASDSEGIEDSVEVEVPSDLESQQGSLEGELNHSRKRLEKTLKQVVTIKSVIPVYQAFVLSSQKNNIIAFRGTNRTSEMVQNFLIFQQDYSEVGYGKIHEGFADAYQAIAQQVRDAAQKLNPALPCYITGHSLGGALATLAALDLALHLPQLKPRLQLYTYASPRVGNPEFATRHTQIIPNSYRVINLADAITLGPPRNFQGMTFTHVGQVWSFLVNAGDIDPNHSFNTYRLAVLREVETDQTRTYPLAGTR